LVELRTLCIFNLSIKNIASGTIMKNILHSNSIQKALIVLAAICVFNSCKKSSDSGTGGTTADQKPKVGTIWTYRYYVYNSPAAGSGIHSTEVLNYKAKNEVVLGGEKWLNIVNMATDTTIFILNEKQEVFINMPITALIYFVKIRQY
jgi:hypothetical protein